MMLLCLCSMLCAAYGWYDDDDDDDDDDRMRAVVIINLPFITQTYVIIVGKCISSHLY